MLKDKYRAEYRNKYRNIKDNSIFISMFIEYRGYKAVVGNLRPTRYFNAADVWLGRTISISFIKTVLFHFTNNQGMEYRNAGKRKALGKNQYRVNTKKASE